MLVSSADLVGVDLDAGGARLRPHRPGLPARQRQQLFYGFADFVMLLVVRLREVPELECPGQLAKRWAVVAVGLRVTLERAGWW